MTVDLVDWMARVFSMGWFLGSMRLQILSAIFDRLFLSG